MIAYLAQLLSWNLTLVHLTFLIRHLCNPFYLAIYQTLIFIALLLSMSLILLLVFSVDFYVCLAPLLSPRLPN